MQLTPEQKAKLRELVDISKDNVSIAAKIMELEDKFEEKFNQAVEAMNALLPIIDTVTGKISELKPIKGKDYLSEEEVSSLIDSVIAKIPVPPTVDEKKLIAKVVKALSKQDKQVQDTTIDYADIASKVQELIPIKSEIKTVETIKEVVSEELKTEIEKLKEELDKKDKRLNIFEDNVKNALNGLRSGGPGGTNVRVLNNGVPVGDTVSELNFTNATSIEYVAGATGRRVNVATGGSGGSGGGLFAIQSVSGTINGSNKVFTISTAFSGKSFIDLNGQMLAEDTDYIVSGTTITYTTAPASDLSGTTHKLYYGVASNQTEAFQITFDGSGSALTVGTKNRIHIPYACTITKIYMYADQTGSAVLDVWKDSYSNYPATVAGTITASAKPTISSAAKSTDSTLTGWTTSISADDHLVVNVNSCSTITWLKLVIVVTRT